MTEPLGSTLSTCNNIIDWIWCQLHLPNLHGYPTNKLSCSDKWLMQQQCKFFCSKNRLGCRTHWIWLIGTGARILITYAAWFPFLKCSGDQRVKMLAPPKCRVVMGDGYTLS